jgi:hypothetical protein
MPLQASSRALTRADSGTIFQLIACMDAWSRQSPIALLVRGRDIYALVEKYSGSTLFLL